MKVALTEPIRAVRRVERSLSQLRRDSAAQYVHHFRTSVRRLEAARALAQGATVSPKLDKAIHAVWRRTAKLRDCDVNLALLRELHLGPELPAQRELQRWFEQRRQRRQRKLERELTSGAGPELARRLQRLRRDWQAAPPQLPPSPAAEALRRYHAAARPAALEPESLHAARKLAKQLRYMAELDRAPANSVQAELARAVEAALRRLQAALGAWHDWAELSDRAAAWRGGAPAPLQAALRNLAGAKLQLALRERAAVEAELERCAAALRRPPASVARAAARRAALA
jgi:CHAD domain-containing protein